MRPIANFTFHAVLAAAIAALATSSAAAEAAQFSLVAASFKNAGGNYAPGKEEQVEIQSFHWGPRQSTSADGSVVAGDVNADGRTGVAGGEAVGGSPGATGMPTGKRQHKPVTFHTELDRSANPMPERGSLTVKGGLPGCKVGAAYPAAKLQTGSARYELKEVIISGCAADSLTVNYAKVTVRGWDPKKKEE